LLRRLSSSPERLNKNYQKMSRWTTRTLLLAALLSCSLLVIHLPSVYTQQNTRVAPQQEQAIPLQILPKDNAGNVDWVKSLRQGLIKPKDSLDPSKPITPVIDLDVVFKVKGDLPDVVYPHYPHTEWLSCSNCHPKIFIMQAGANKVTMKKIEEGQFCGRCHGIVAFPLSNCTRCHSKPKR
jgi:c(7)-type cytochrome triheme protein